jgi:predicted TIM-barrel fold metal-dependent hydrolase
MRNTVIMRVITLEEHYFTAAVDQAVVRPGLKPPELHDVGERRIAAMDAAGIDVQVLSMAAPAVQTLEPDAAVPLAVESNDQLAETVAAHPDRYAGFATLPTTDPKAAAGELERAVRQLGMKGAMIHGHTHGQFLDEPQFWPVLEAAEGLEVPIYLHPTYPPQVVRDAYFSGLDPAVAGSLASSGWGWHAETALHSLRMVAAGIFDRFPGLQFILGHMGENLPFYLDRANRKLGKVTAHLQRPLADYLLTQFHITTSGFVSLPPLECTLAVFGADRIMFSVDYPFEDMREARDFLDAAPLAPADKEKIAHGNAERLLNL